jgi:hypothetical protein
VHLKRTGKTNAISAKRLGLAARITVLFTSALRVLMGDYRWRRSRYPSLYCQMDQKGTDFWSAHGHRVALVMEEDKAFGPLYIRLFRSDTHVFEA